MPSQHQDLRGATAIVTGASDGIGAVTARELARAGARVVLAVRNPDKAHAAAQNWPDETHQLLLPHVTGRIVTVSSDLHKYASIDRTTCAARHGPGLRPGWRAASQGRERSRLRRG